MGVGNRLKSSGEQRPRGWFSRRHETDEANREARDRYRFERGEEARRRRANERNSDA